MALSKPPDIGKLKAKGNVKGLIKALGYLGDSKVRRAAAEALGETSDARAVEPLIKALSLKWPGRKDAAKALLRIYREGNLSQKQKQLVLECKPQITQEHHDSDSCGSHGDSGIGIAFDI